MRLGQLARKLSLRPAEIVTFLAKQNIQIENNGNTRIEDDHVKMILAKYAPDEKFEQDVIEEVIETPVVPEHVETVASQPEYVEPEQSVSTIVEEKIEVIKAPKIELSGLKVLGKIELPEPKKKEQSAAESRPEENQSAETAPKEIRPRQERKPYQQKREQRTSVTSRPQKNPIALQREREAKEAEEKRRIAQEQNKEKRALHYLKKVNTKQPAVRVTKVVDEPSERQVEIAPPAPKSVFGKFMRWLTSSR